MSSALTKLEMLARLNEVTQRFVSTTTAIPDELFFVQPADKWSIAQNVIHLDKAARMTSLAYRLPKFMVRLYAGKPNRASRSYDELVAKYKLKLEQGGKASGPFIPKPAPAGQSKENLILHFESTMHKLSGAIVRYWNENQFDRYLAPHPLLGKLTLRELIYFTIYHTEHHLSIIKSRG